MSHIQYKFRSSKDYSTAVFDGLSIPVADLKQDILREQKLNPDDFDLVITNEQTSEDYKDDAALIPKNTVVLVRRIPYTGPKMSRMAAAASYRQPAAGYGGMPYGAGPRGPGMAPTGPGSQYGYRGPQGVGMGAQRGNGSQNQNDNAMDTDANEPDDARISAMLQQSSDQWMHQQSIMDMQRPVGGRGGFRGRPNFVRPEHQQPPPPGYVCHRCGMQGHWIYSCPTQAQGDGTGKPNMHRVKRTTGIPKSFLQKVENLDDVGNALVTSDGTLVVATANEAAWNTAQRLARNAITTDSDIDPSLVPDELKCRTCQSLVRDATVAPCCQAVFCSTCIERQLLDPGPMHFTCPACRAGLVPDQLEVATETRGKVDEFLRDYSSRQNPTTNDDGDDDKGTENPGADSTPAATNGANSAKSDTASAGAATSTAPAVSTPAVTGPSANNTYIPRPPVQVPPRPRPMGMMPGMMSGMMMGGFPGMPMGQMPFMPGMVPSGMMGQWNGMAPPSAAQAGGPKSDGANSAGYVAPAMDRQTRDGSRGRRDHRSARDSSRASRDRSRDGRRRGYGRSRERGRDRSRGRSREYDSRGHRDSRRDEGRRDDNRRRRDESGDRRSSRREESTDRRSSRREESTDRRSSRREESTDRRSSRREESTDRRSSRREESADRGDGRRSGRSRSPAMRGSRRRSRDSKPGELAIRGQSTGAAAESKPRSILERLGEKHPTRSEQPNGRSGGRRNRNRRR